MPTSTPKTRSRSPLALDPSRTGDLRRGFVREVRTRLAEIAREVYDLIAVEDAFGLRVSKPYRPLTFNEKLKLASAEKFGALMLAVHDGEVIDFVDRVQSFLEPDDVIEKEDWPHITVRYGFTAEVDHERIQPIIDQHGPIGVIVEGLSLFQNEDADVLKMDVSSPSLTALYRHLGILPNVQTYSGYSPHLTIAYLKPGTGQKYVDHWFKRHPATVFRMTLSKLVYSTPTREKTELVLNQRWRFLTNPQKLSAFVRWIDSRFKVTLLQEERADDLTYWNKYIEDGYRRGAGRAFEEVRGRTKGTTKEQLDFYRGSRAEFLRSAFANRESVEKVKLLAGRTLTDLKNVSTTTATQMSRVLTDGLVQGKNPGEVARDLIKQIRTVAYPRAETIARTEIIRAHAEGQLDAMERLGVVTVGVAVEWSTAGDDRVCPLCRPMDGVILKIKESHGLIPRHPNCRCAFTPANVGEDKDGQLRSKRAIEQAITDSIAKERPKRQKRSIEQQRKLSKWIGADAKMDPNRPKSMF